MHAQEGDRHLDAGPQGVKNALIATAAISSTTTIRSPVWRRQVGWEGVASIAPTAAASARARYGWKAMP
ncbi:hypothetical protein [Arenivirga flava]|uniref:hypothetical protein n=1 Tax=Arenivirga flava TaxID=1930060 RepID=UPI0024E0FA69|nr:hypothetical protein [Arenivirga flava]